MKLVVAVSGATGAIYAVKLLEALKKANIEIHLIVSKWAEKTIELETDFSIQMVKDKADFCYEETNMAAAVSSGSFVHQGMVIIPCSMKTLAGIAHGYSANLIARAADVTLKEGRKLIIVPRETPLNVIHLENMLILARAGVQIVPPMPAFYFRPQNIDELVQHFVGRILDRLGIDHEQSSAWKGLD